MPDEASPAEKPPARGRVPREFAVLGFGSTHAALDAEALLGDLGVGVVTIPTPRTLGAHCGIALRLELDDLGRALRLLDNAGISVESQGTVEDLAQNGR